MGQIVRIKINGVLYDVAAERVADKSITPAKLTKMMDFNTNEEDRRTFVFREGDLKVADGGHNFGSPVLTQGTKVNNIADEAIKANHIADKAILPAKLTKMMDFNTNEEDRHTFVFREGDLRVADSGQNFGSPVLTQGTKVSNIADEAVGTNHLEDRAVTGDKVDYQAIQDVHLAFDAVHAKAIKSGAVSYEKLHSDVKDRMGENASIAKGANAGLGFETKALMDAYIASKKLPSYEGTIPAGSYVVLSCDFELAELESPSLTGDTEFVEANLANIGIGSELVRNDYDYYYNEGANSHIYVKSNRYYLVQRILKDCDASDIGWDLRAYNGMGSEDFTSNKRLTVIETAEPTVDDILAYDIPYATSMYIEDTEVPDYWWNGARALELETQKIDLANYVKREQYDALEARIAILEEMVTSDG